ncbi:cupin domain-containing protein [Agromyces sp. ISL-38]|uniref:cupin domain-containing protein n=1 Tax=Agromyces sp. ISL-38 TaxID=2819107 RepID=UPI001BE5D037|nr:cupin domain-containing protein [Agromyces sp. ISL-38]MBT2500164.1 cupin domain-containing protein [Agromyces sp. ISL-38]MBT2516831.1 cupin domain-containing protein [Streptomyces sp. ISL-90]
MIINFAAELAAVTDHWTPRVVGQVNNEYVKVAKLFGELMWHDHADEDELFLVVYGRLVIQLEDRDDVVLNPGEAFVVPRGVRHNPVAKEECGIVLVETVTTKHTGDEASDRSVPLDRQLDRFAVRAQVEPTD